MKLSVLGTLLSLAAMPALAHNGVVHETNTDAQKHLESVSEDQPSTPFNLNLGGAFQLTDQTGSTRTETDPNGQMQLLFFGYANCQAICSVALPLMADVVTDLATSDLNVTPVMVTVDPSRDTIDTIGAPLKKHHPDFVGLTGSMEDLQKIYDLYSVENTVVFTDPELGDIFAHGSHIYLLDAKGKFLTLLPPILSAKRISELVKKYASGAS
jgi:protein SCO1/2